MPIHINQFNIELFNKPVQVNITEETTVIFGANGSGKSKLLEAIAKHYESKTYYIVFNNVTLEYDMLSILFYFKPEDLKEDSKLQIAFNIFCKLIKETLNKEIYYNGHEYKIRLNNGNIIDDYVLALSFGEVILINTLVQVLETVLLDVNILLIDNPETGLNVSIQRYLFKMFREINPNLQIIAVSHSPAIVDFKLKQLLDIQSIFDINQM